MKRKLFLLILSFLSVSILNYANNIPKDKPYTGSHDDIEIALISEELIINTTEDSVCKIIFVFRNIGNRKIAFFGIKPLYSSSLFLEYSGENSEFIKLVYPFGYSGISGGRGKYIEPGKSEVDVFDLATYTNLREFPSSSTIDIKGLYEILSQEFGSKRLGFVSSNPIRIFINMDQELTDAKMVVEPHKWNIAWEKEKVDGGVFTAFLGNIEGYSAEDIMQDTVLFNGTLKPIEMKIVDGHKEMEGKVLMLKFKKKDGMEYLGIKEPGDIKKINISGQLNDEKWFYAETEVEITGKKEKESKE